MEAETGGEPEFVVVYVDDVDDYAAWKYHRRSCIFRRLGACESRVPSTRDCPARASCSNSWLDL